MSQKVSGAVVFTGVAEWLQALRMMNEGTRSRVRDAIQVTTANIATRARSNVPVSDAADRKAKGRPGPGELRDSIRESYGTSGLTGYVLAGFGKLPRASRSKLPVKLGPMKLKAYQRFQKRQALKAMREIGVYAMVVNYGSPGRGIPGSRFMDRAKESERQAHIARIRAALNSAASSATSRAA